MMDSFDEGHEDFLWNRVEQSKKYQEHCEDNPFFSWAVKYNYKHSAGAVARSISSMYSGAAISVLGVEDRIRGASGIRRNLNIPYVQFEGVMPFHLGGGRFRGEIPLGELRPEDYKIKALRKTKINPSAVADKLLAGILGKTPESLENAPNEQRTLKALEERGYSPDLIRERISSKLSKKYEKFIYPDEIHIIKFDKDYRELSYRYSNELSTARLKKHSNMIK